MTIYAPSTAVRRTTPEGATNRAPSPRHQGSESSLSLGAGRSEHDVDTLGIIEPGGYASAVAPRPALSLRQGKGGVSLRGAVARRAALSSTGLVRTQLDAPARRQGDVGSLRSLSEVEGERSHPLVRELAAVGFCEPNIFEIIWNWILSLFEVLDPYRDQRRQVEAIIGTIDEARALVAHYTRGGRFVAEALEADVARILEVTHPELSPERQRELGGILAHHARIIAENRINRLGTPPTGLPTRPLTVEATPYPQRDIEVDGMRLRMIDVGPTEPGPCRGTIVLVHGHGSSVEEFTPLIPLLSRHYRVVAMDLPGSGYSEQPDRDYSLAFYEDTILHCMDRLDIERATVAGGSMGGNLALRLGRRAPERFPTVVSWSPASVWPAGSHDALAWMAENLSTGVFYWPMLRHQSSHWMDDDHPNREEIIRACMRYRQEVDSPIFRRATAQIAAEQLRSSHRGLGHLNTQPTLVMVGDHDDGLGLSDHAAEFSRELPAGELVRFPEGGHSLHGEYPEALAQRMLDFLARHQGAHPTDR